MKKTYSNNIDELNEIIGAVSNRRYAALSAPEKYKKAIENIESKSTQPKWELNLRGNFHTVLAFVTRKSELEKIIDKLTKHSSENFLIVWPKSQSNIVTDLNRDIVTECLSNIKDFKFLKGIIVDESWRAVMFQNILFSEKN